MLTIWLEQHGFICIKDYNTSLVYQKINKYIEILINNQLNVFSLVRSLLN